MTHEGQPIQPRIPPPAPYDFLYETHEIVIFKVTARLGKSDLLKVLEKTTKPEAILTAYSDLGRLMSAQRIDQRLAHGLRFFEMYISDRLVATTWTIGDGTRFFDEVAYHFPAPSGTIWIRDIFVSPEFRGRQLLGTFLDALVAGPLSGAQTLWSDVNRTNIGSLKAHAQYGFHEVTYLRRRHVGRLLLTRTSDPPGFLNLDGYQTGRAIVFTGPSFNKYATKNLA